MSTDEPMPETTKLEPRTPAERAIVILNEALTGYSGKSKNTLIKEAIKVLQG